MKTKVSDRFQTVVPSRIRKKYNIAPGSYLIWQEQGNAILLVPVPENPIKEFRGKSKGLTRALLEERKQEREHEKKAGKE